MDRVNLLHLNLFQYQKFAVNLLSMLLWTPDTKSGVPIRIAWQVSCMILSLFSLDLKSLVESCRYRSILYFPVTPLGIFVFIFCPLVVLTWPKYRGLVSFKSHIWISHFFNQPDKSLIERFANVCNMVCLTNCLLICSVWYVIIKKIKRNRYKIPILSLLYALGSLHQLRLQSELAKQ